MNLYLAKSLSIKLPEVLIQKNFINDLQNKLVRKNILGQSHFITFKI